ncbi:MFS transporter [Acinetobacter stercoris]|uniref:Multidrug resistance protein D n=1 Tax=Acinetobacter stercoris TaxID=2126983 RepID=A0A2U3MXP6_9GAMM|nr:MFS transporter [Acinetobacter stercoris]SPL70208.1 multidrug resistance protein D [Acinetobacter stercoris]
MNNSSLKHPNAGFRLSPKSALILHTLTLMTFMAASSAPTPLYRLYQQIWLFSPVILTLIFAIYAFSLLASLLVIGSLSDYIGRKPVILLALVLQISSMVLFLYASAPVMLFIARALQGVATGLAVSAIGASLLDLSKEHGSLINSICPMIGMAFGALIACTILQFSTFPLQLIFEVLIFTLFIELCLCCIAPETAKKRVGAWASLKPKMAIPVQARHALLKVSPVNIALWMVSGFYLSLMPSLLAKAFNTHSAWLSGLSFIALTISGAIAIFLLRQSKTSIILLTGTITIMIGALIILLGVNLTQATLLFSGSIIAGIGFGSGFMGAIRSVMPLAQPEQRAGLMAAFFVESYLAFSIPAIIAGYLVNKIGLINSANIYGSLIVFLALLALCLVLRDQRVQAE